MSPRELRPYQSEAVQSVMNEWGVGTRRTAVVLPTGTGKSTVIAALAAESVRLGLRVGMFAHRAELLDQMASTVTEVAPDLPRPGIVRAEQDERHAPIVAASFQTLVNETRLAGIGERQVVLVDETHHVTADSYRRVVESFGPETFFCGFTATLRRGDGKALRDMIDTIAYEKTLRWAIDADFLVRPTGVTVKIPDLDLDAVKTTAGDYSQDALAEVMEAETHEVVKAIVRHGVGRRPIIFAASVQAAFDIADGLSQMGMPAHAVTGTMPYEERKWIYDRFRTGEIQALVTVQVLTEGADFPMCDMVAIARPTQSQNLYSQMVGRALRLFTYPDGRVKDDALVLDLVGVARAMKLVTLSSLDAGTHSRTVDTEGEDLPPEDDDDEDPLLAGIAGITDAPKKRRLGPIQTIDIDLLGPEETGVLWLGTVKGVPFICPPESGEAVFLWETGYDAVGSLYRIGVMPVKGRKGAANWLDNGRSWPLSIAKDIAEDYCVDSGYKFPLRAASWRRSAPPSEAQIRYAHHLGVIAAETMTKARLSDEISIALMSDRLDGAR